MPHSTAASAALEAAGKPASLPATGRLESRGVVRGASRDRSSLARPGWGWLYAIPLIAAGLLVVIYSTLRSGVWRTAAESGVAAVSLVFFALWLAANRPRLARFEAGAGASLLPTDSPLNPSSAAVRRVSDGPPP